MDHKTKEERVADVLRENIVSGVYTRGARLKQAEIARELSLSITPVREALKILEAEGYIERDSYKGTRVAQVSAEALTELVELRIVLEVRLVQGAMERITCDDQQALAALADEVARMYSDGDPALVRDANYRLHRRLYEIANMPLTLQLVQSLWARYPFDMIDSDSGRVVAEHDTLLQALAGRDPVAAGVALRRHIESGWEALKRCAPK